jgi:hypothetical protein
MTNPKELKTGDLCQAWVTKYDYQVRLVEGKITIGGWSRGRRNIQFSPEGSSHWENLVIGKDAFLTKEEAVADVRARREKRVAALEEALYQLRSTPEIEHTEQVTA